MDSNAVSLGFVGFPRVDSSDVWRHEFNSDNTIDDVKTIIAVMSVGCQSRKRAVGLS